jgi:hypothetical protein
MANSRISITEGVNGKELKNLRKIKNEFAEKTYKIEKTQKSGNILPLLFCEPNYQFGPFLQRQLGNIRFHYWNR